MLRFRNGMSESMRAVKLLPDIENYYKNSKEIVIANLYDCHMPGVVQFPNAERIVVLNWEKNAVFYNLDMRHFPAAKEIVFLSSHPCEHSVLFRFPAHTKWILDDLSCVPHRFFMDVHPECKEISRGIKANYTTSSGEINLPGLGQLTSMVLDSQFNAYVKHAEYLADELR